MPKIVEIDNCCECKYFEQDNQEDPDLWGHALCWNEENKERKDLDSGVPLLIDGTIGTHKGCPLQESKP